METTTESTQRSDEFEAAKAQLLDEIRGKIEQYGQAIISVGPGDLPPYSYTVGRSWINEPEIMAWGLPRELAHGLLNMIHCAVVQNDVKLDEPVIISGLLDGGFRLALVPLSDEFAAGMLPIADNLKKEHEVQAVQMVVPDRNNLLPWEPDYDHRRMTGQLETWDAEALNKPSEWRQITLNQPVPPVTH